MAKTAKQQKTPAQKAWDTRRINAERNKRTAVANKAWATRRAVQK